MQVYRTGGRPHGGGHLFNPPTHRHKRGCLIAPTVLRIKFSKKFHAFPKGHLLCFSIMPFQKIFQKKIHHFPQGHPTLFYYNLSKKILKKIFSYVSQKSHHIIIFNFYFNYECLIKNKISTTIFFS